MGKLARLNAEKRRLSGTSYTGLRKKIAPASPRKSLKNWMSWAWHGWRECAVNNPNSNLLNCIEKRKLSCLIAARNH